MEMLLLCNIQLVSFTVSIKQDFIHYMGGKLFRMVRMSQMASFYMWKC
jgi:hypothetical protein